MTAWTTPRGKYPRCSKSAVELANSRTFLKSPGSHQAGTSMRTLCVWLATQTSYCTAMATSFAPTGGERSGHRVDHSLRQVPQVLQKRCRDRKFAHVLKVPGLAPGGHLDPYRVFVFGDADFVFHRHGVLLCAKRMVRLWSRDNRRDPQSPASDSPRVIPCKSLVKTQRRALSARRLSEAGRESTRSRCGAEDRT